MDFAFWLQLKEVAPYDTRMRLVLHIDLNMMMRMMIGSKIQGCDRPDRRGARQVVQRRPAGLSGRRPQGERRPEGRHRRCEALTDERASLFAKKSRPPYRHRRNGVCRTTDTARQTSRSASADAADPFFRRRDFEIPPKYVIFVRTINHQYSAHGTPRFHQLRK